MNNDARLIAESAAIKEPETAGLIAENPAIKEPGKLPEPATLAMALTVDALDTLGLVLEMVDKGDGFTPAEIRQLAPVVAAMVNAGNLLFDRLTVVLNARLRVAGRARRRTPPARA
jgi:hypothetical protein